MRGQNAGFAGSGAGQHQHRPVQRLNGLPLFGIEAREIGRSRRRGPHGARGYAPAGPGPAVRSARDCASEGQPQGPPANVSRHHFHGPKMAPEHGFYEASAACAGSPLDARAFPGCGAARSGAPPLQGVAQARRLRAPAPGQLPGLQCITPLRCVLHCARETWPILSLPGRRLPAWRWRS